MFTCLYHTCIGRLILKFLTWPPLSRLAGRFLDTHFSRHLIPGFIRRNHLRMDDFIVEEWPSFNAFFTRKIRPEARPVDLAADAFISPCDGLLRVYPIHEKLVLPVKDVPYSLPALLQNRRLAAEYEGGMCLVFRLTPSHYHRYVYPDKGRKSRNIFIPGILHTVQPVATETVPVYRRNSREYTLLRTEHFGTITFMEVGAMMVGRICNYMEEGTFQKGQEKGRFEFGGSTILLLLQKDKVKLRSDWKEAWMQEREVPVKMGERIGRAVKKPDAAEHFPENENNFG